MAVKKTAGVGSMGDQVAVVGGGVIGLAIAHELATRGSDVTLFERDTLPSGGMSDRQSALERCSWQPRSAASWAAAGILPPANLQTATDPIDRLRGLSHRLYPDWVAELQRASGVDCQLDRCGGYYLADSAGEVASMVGMLEYWRELEIECTQIELGELVRSQPQLEAWAESRSLARAWWVPDEYQICTPRLLLALTAACERKGVRLCHSARVVAMNSDSGGAVVTLGALGRSPEPERSPAPENSTLPGRRSPRKETPRGVDPPDRRRSLRFDRAVLCGGVWSGLADPDLRLRQSLVPVRGQMLLLRPDRPFFSSVINLGHRYLVPRRSGDVLVGSCEEEVGLQHGTTPGQLAALREFVYQVCPPLGRAREVAAWSGLRPMTFDGFPICGKLPGTDALFVATGHFRSGVHLAPATATCLADLMTGSQPQVSLDAFAVGKQQHSSETC